MIEIKLKHDNDFLKIKETLTRVGIANKSKKKLYQSCHIFHKQGRYFIAHFKDMMIHDGIVDVNITDEDIDRRHEITRLLVEWGLCTTVNEIPELTGEINLFIISFHDKKEWDLIPKFKMGKDNDRSEH